MDSTTSWTTYSTYSTQNSQTWASTTTVEENLTSEPMSDVTAVFTLLIAIFGTVANSLTLSYFNSLIKSQDSSRNSGASMAKLFAALNFFDLLVCVSSTCEFLLIIFVYNDVPSEVFRKSVTRISVLMTGFITCLLALLRGIHLVLPFHIINWRAVKVSIIVYGFMITALRVFYLQNYVISDESFVISAVETVQFFVLAGTFQILVLFIGVCLVKLCCSSELHNDVQESKATTTIVILSVVYCLCHLGSVIVYGREKFLNSSSMPLGQVDISYYILLPLNSACNPVVYFIRERDVRSYVRRFWGR